MKKYFLLFCIVFLAGILRFWQLGSIPASLTWDEAAWGYNAYSLGTTGKDEFGKFLPLAYLESFGDYKPPAYAYLDVLPVKLFGLNEFATRFPSAFFGTLTVLVAYLLVKQIFKNSTHSDWYALSTAGILAVSPWHIMLSRAAFEANVATCFIVTGVWLFLVAVQKNMWYLPLSIISFIITIYTFNTSRIVSPLLIVFLSIVFIKVLWRNKVPTILAICLGFLLLIPSIKFLMSPQAAIRFDEVNIFSDVTLVKTSNQEIANDHTMWWSKVLHNRRVVYLSAFLRHYFDNLTPGFLFIHGDGNPKFSTQDVGELYLWDVPFFVAGILLLCKKREGKWWLIPVWLILGIIPAATARETPHALRIETTLPTFQILVAYGFVQALVLFKKQQKILVPILLFLLFLNVLYFEHGYFFHYTKEYAGEWQYGYKDVFSYLQSVGKNYRSIQFTDQLGRPYIYYLFYTKTSPTLFENTANIARDVFGFVHVNSIGKYYFATNLPIEKNSLYVNVPHNVPTNAHIQKTFFLPNGKVVLEAYTL